MSSFCQALKVILNKPASTSRYFCTRRLLNSAVCYDDKDPASAFFNKDVQILLKTLTRVDYEKVFRRRKLGKKHLSDPEYKFMTDTELQQSLQDVKKKADELMQIPPAVKVRNITKNILSKDPALQGLENSRIIFTDISYGINNADRLIVVREPDGTLQKVESEVRHRMNQTYFPEKGKLIKTPRLFQGHYLESLLDRHEYEYVLDRACIQFEPDDPEYQRVTSITYQHVNDNHNFEILRSTRHFGALTFFLIWNRNIDNLLLELIETLHIGDAKDLVTLYSLVHKIQFEGKSDLDIIADFVKKVASKKGALELAIQAYKDINKDINIQQESTQKPPDTVIN